LGHDESSGWFYTFARHNAGSVLTIIGSGVKKVRDTKTADWNVAVDEFVGVPLLHTRMA
jgi:hypothetical protein